MFRRAHSPITRPFRRSPLGDRAPPPVCATARRFRPDSERARVMPAARAAAPIDLSRGYALRPDQEYPIDGALRALPGGGAPPRPGGHWRARREIDSRRSMHTIMVISATRSDCHCCGSAFRYNSNYSVPCNRSKGACWPNRYIERHEMQHLSPSPTASN
jgi:hypothetical protein